MTMQSSPQTRANRRKRTKFDRLPADDFQRLGLGLSEARVSVIRQAARQMTADLASQVVQTRRGKSEEELASMLASVYRLLDPRRRDHIAERIQLLRAEPTPVRSQLLQADGKREDPIADADAQAAEQTDDWMLAMVADLRLAPPSKGSTTYHEAREAVDVIRQATSLKSRCKAGWRLLKQHLLLVVPVAVVAVSLVMLIVVILTNDRATIELTDNTSPSPSPVEVRQQPSLTPQQVPSPTTRPGTDLNRFVLPPVRSPETPPEETEPTDLAVADNVSLPSPSPETNADSEQPQPELPLEPATEETAAEETTDVRPIPLVTPADPNPRPTPLPPSEALALARQKHLATERFTAATALEKETASRLMRQYAQHEPGTAERFVCGADLAERQVLAGDFAQAYQTIARLALDFLATDHLLAHMVLVGASQRAATSSEQTAIAQWALRVAESCLVAEDFAMAQEAARVGTTAIASSNQSDLRAALKTKRDVLSQAIRLAENYANLPSDPGPLQSSPANATVRARFLCFYLNRWDDGIAWMAAGNEARLAAIAHDEISLLQPNRAPATQESALVAVAHRWLDAADKQRGRAADSIRLHAYQLLRQAEQLAKGPTKLEIQQEAERLANQLPSEMLPIPLHTVIADRISGSSALANNGSPSALNTTENPLQPGILGRVSVAGEDMGVLLTYADELPLPVTALDAISQRLGNSIAQVRLQFFGALAIADDTLVRCELHGMADPNAMTSGEVSFVINGVSHPLRRDGDIVVAEINLPAGVHQFIWQQAVTIQVEGNRRLQLILRDVKTQQVLPLGHNALTQQYSEQWPTSLRILLRG
jgi:hypothetical protein